jgi:hypothetical protein
VPYGCGVHLSEFCGLSLSNAFGRSFVLYVYNKLCEGEANILSIGKVETVLYMILKYKFVPNPCKRQALSVNQTKVSSTLKCTYVKGKYLIKSKYISSSQEFKKEDVSSIWLFSLASKCFIRSAGKTIGC